MKRMSAFSLLLVILWLQACTQSSQQISDQQLLATVVLPPFKSPLAELEHPISAELIQAVSEPFSDVTVDKSSPSRLSNTRFPVDPIRAEGSRLRTRGSVDNRRMAIRLRQLVFNDERFNWRYRALVDNRQDVEAFTGNCLDFASWVVTHARELGLEANFELVNDSSGWETMDDTWIRMDHAVAVVTVGKANFRFDVTGQEAMESLSQPLLDSEALGLLRSNQAVSAWRRDDLTTAAILAKEAVELFPEHAGLWLNLANFYQPSLAQETALLTRASQATIAPEIGLNALARFYQRQGDMRRVRFIERQIASYMEAQPVTHVARAERAIASSEWTEAIAHLERAVELAPQVVELHYSLAALYRKRGWTHRADVTLAEAREKDSAQGTGIYYAKLRQLH
ncbi:hypothetical protein [uncultured Umboniibacter sp.]|uniref:hypothetical protein n=1 Tax=uncultured Umboniibacter sp. TaxID=1798917 RepID=UPI002608443F|nr:hypothetical protein [uncultured Umboniibacter sp.]